MRTLILLPLFWLLQICQAFQSPDIYSLTQPAGASAALSEDSQAATVPSRSRLGEQTHLMMLFTDGAMLDMQPDQVLRSTSLYPVIDQTPTGTLSQRSLISEQQITPYHASSYASSQDNWIASKGY